MLTGVAGTHVGFLTPPQYDLSRPGRKLVRTASVEAIRLKLKLRAPGHLSVTDH